MKKITLLALTGVALLSLLAPARAAVIFSSYNGNFSGNSSQLNSTSGKAVAFTMPVSLQPDGTTSYLLDSVSIGLSGNLSSSAVVLALYTNDGINTPGTQITSFTPLSSFTLTSTPDNYIFTPTSPVSLTAGTTYWVTLYTTASMGSGGALNWRTSSPNTPSSTVEVTLGGAVFGPNSNPSSWTSTSSTINTLTVNATALPEPTAAALVSLSALGFVTMLRRKRR